MIPKVGLINTWAFLEETTAAVAKAGGIPMVIPINAGLVNAKEYIDMVDGLLVPGGEDVTPDLYGQEPRPQVVLSRQDKDEFEIALINEALAQKKPIFGICRGLQLLNVVFGGTLIQDIPTQIQKPVCHDQASETPNELLHRVEIVEDSLLSRILVAAELDVNSLHHQSVDRLGDGLVVSATAKDGVIEGIETQDGLIFAVQWHPECLFTRYPHFLELFTHFIRLCAERKESLS